MPRSSRYEIIDEPARSTFTHLVVSPTFPMFGFMLGGALVGWVWFVVNGFASGSATRKKELGIALATPVVLLGLYAALDGLHRVGVLPAAQARYALLAFVLVKLGSMYAIFANQSRSHELYTYFGGPSRNGAFILMGAIILSRSLFADASPLVKLVLQ